MLFLDPHFRLFMQKGKKKGGWSFSFSLRKIDKLFEDLLWGWVISLAVVLRKRWRQKMKLDQQQAESPFPEHLERLNKLHMAHIEFTHC